MSQLKDIGVETAEITVRPAKGDKPRRFLSVRGLSCEDTLRVFKIHGGAIAALFDAVQKNKIELNLANTATIAGLLMDQAPDIVADIIVIATDSDNVNEDFETAKKLPIPVQLAALEQIAVLTFVDQTPGEFLEIVLRMMGGMNGLLRETLPAVAKGAIKAAQNAN